MCLTPYKRFFKKSIDWGVKLGVTWLHMTAKKQMRAAYRRRDRVFIGTWIPLRLAEQLEALILKEDSDRSKIVRKAIQSRLQEVNQ